MSPYILIADSTFSQVGGKLESKVKKLKENKLGKKKKGDEVALTHLRQGAEWGNNTLVARFRGLKN